VLITIKIRTKIHSLNKSLIKARLVLFPFPIKNKVGSVISLKISHDSRIQGRAEGMSWGVSQPPNENTSRQSDLFHYNLEGPNFTYGKQILHIS
jgi:hypothetical protein